ncbi:MAG: type II toxin-antitoxin system PemK/MazF family toxin [Tabrizicola sp.]|nr:type II toxin-antitoxin system PemK/MazF family toxin [Tabrizicola sp.]
MPLQFHPKQGAVVLVRFDAAFKEPEMVKPRPCVVVSPKMKARPGLCTVVPLSTTAPSQVMPFHAEIELGFDLPAPWTSRKCWVKGDMIYAIGLHRADLFRLGRGKDGRRVYLTETLDPANFAQVQACILAGLGLRP